MTGYTPILVGIVCYNNIKHIRRCLDSLNHQNYPNLRIIVIDNSSSDGTADFIAKNFPNIELIRSEKNLGFGQGHNQILKKREAGEHYFALNPDAFLDADYIQKSFNAFSYDSKIGTVNGIVCYFENDQKTDVIFSRGHHYCQERRIESIDIGNYFDPHFDHEYIFGPNGCAFLIHSNCIEDVSLNEGLLFEPDFFLYSEDEELGFRIQRAGWKNLSLGGIQAWHIAGGSLPMKSPRAIQDCIANRYLTVIRHDSIPHFIQSLWAIFIVEGAFVFLNGIKKPRFFLHYLGSLVKVIRLAPKVFFKIIELRRSSIKAFLALLWWLRF
jgi:GT2 family glycosyltransferase